MKWLLGCLLLLLGIIVLGARQQVRPGFITTHDWATSGQWLRADLHTHTKASDGAPTVSELAKRAAEGGCDALAITDHADRKLRAATPQYFADIATARAEQPEMVILTGLEWNVPPSKGDEHATLLMPDTPRASQVLSEFKERFDDYDRGETPAPSVVDALRWLERSTAGSKVKPVLVYNHPSRKDVTSVGNADDMLRWRAVNSLFVAFEGGPGHQGRPPYGSYSKQVQTVDRWDPVVAQPGDAWDMVLQKGLDVHGAITSSDFHNDFPGDLNDFWPCRFNQTMYFVPEKSVDGILRAIRAGTFFGSHGQIVTAADLTATVAGLPRPAIVGERVRVPSGTEATISLSLDIPATDWQGQLNRVDQVEFFIIGPGSVDTRTYPILGTGRQTVTARVVAAAGGVVVRARARRVVDDGPDLMAYTNAIRLVVN